MLSISVVDGVPLPAGEEFTGVIRTQDVRATEKDKVKIGDCFRGGDVVKGLVVCTRTSHVYEIGKLITDHVRFLLVMLEVTISLLLEMTLA
jgi:exosome complex RNA-binding protein Csl4